MIQPPAYFEAIRAKAAQRWAQLEGDRELAAPWHQLFKQVQSPRHVLSELLQNADDARATEARVSVDGSVFTFEHNGDDFTEKHFASLCRFGYSNKRALHTIGFRGIGFKSTFSLGDRVEIHTPTLAVAFHSARFTEPHWIQGQTGTDGSTRVRVVMSDTRRVEEVQKNFTEWVGNAESLLFFKNIRSLDVQGRMVRWHCVGDGPVPGSEYMALDGSRGEPLLLLRSAEEHLPAPVAAEIREERMMDEGDDAASLPACRVEVLLGAEGRLFVVLPTGVKTSLPFACNAPFLQDPARLRIKPTETSATNRWLLERVGRLAASVMLEWLGRADWSIADRAKAYGLLPGPTPIDPSLEGRVRQAVDAAIVQTLSDRRFLLTEAGELVRARGCIAMPPIVISTWSSEKASALVDDGHRVPLSPSVSTADTKTLVDRGFVDNISMDLLLTALQKRSPGMPRSWRDLLRFWAYVSPTITRMPTFEPHESHARAIRIFPVQGDGPLHAAGSVVRLGEGRLLQSEADWNFLSVHLTVLNGNWTRFLAEHKRLAEMGRDTQLLAEVSRAQALLIRLGLHEASDAGEVIDRFAAAFFSRAATVDPADCVRLAQIAAKLDARTGPAFRFLTKMRVLREPMFQVFFDDGRDGGLSDLLPEKAAQRVLSPLYAAAFTTCSRDDWQRWIASGRSGLLTFLPLLSKTATIRRDQISAEVKRRGGSGHFTEPYRTSNFRFEDFDFDPDAWAHWEGRALTDPRVWTRVVNRILGQPKSYWEGASSAHVLQVATSNSTRVVVDEPLLPAWVLRLRKVPCLLDSRGQASRPEELLRRTADTEALLDVEPFVHSQYDIEAFRPLLDLLGVRSKPMGPEALLGRLRALARAEKPPVAEVEKWYRRLDRMIEGGSTQNFQTVRDAFQTERLVFTSDGIWATAASVFLSADEDDVPGAALVRPSVSDLALWRRIGLAERPTADLAIQWLKTLPSGAALAPEDARRVRALQVRHPLRVFHDCSHWMNLAGEWVSVSSLSYSLTMQSLIAWKHLHPVVKQKTLDAQRLPVEVTSQPPFAVFPSLSESLEERLHKGAVAAEPEAKPWITTLGRGLARVKLDTDELTSKVRALGDRLAKTSWVKTTNLEILPYMNGVPAGVPRPVEVFWHGETLHVAALSKAKLARRVPAEIGISFGGIPDIQAALDYSYERSPEDVLTYLEANFQLEAPTARLAPNSVPAALQAPAVPPSQIEQPRGVEALALGDEPTAPEDSDFLDQPEPNGTSPQAARQEAAEARAPRSEQRASLIERFAAQRGYRRQDEHRFRHANGAWIGYNRGDVFPWVAYSAAGEVQCRYWLKDHCLESGPLDITFEMWTQLSEHPDDHALILVDGPGQPTEITGGLCRQWVHEGRITLHPAAYRLVYREPGDAPDRFARFD